MDVGGGALEIAFAPRQVHVRDILRRHRRRLAPRIRIPTWGARCVRAGSTLLALAIIVAGGVALRMYGLYGRSMWFDEGFSWRTIRFPSRR